MSNRKLAVLISFSGAGGVENMVINLLEEFAQRPDLDIDLLAIRDSSAYMEKIPESIRLIKLKANHTSTALRELTEYLAQTRPDAMLVAKDRAGRLAVKARRAAAVNTRLVMRLGTNLSTAMAGKSFISRWLRYRPIRRLYPLVDCIVAVSEGVARDTAAISRINPKRIRVIRNPVITPRLYELSNADSPHPWLAREHTVPVVLAAGRMTRQKDFATLIQAFKQLTTTTSARLIILGDGSLKSSLQQLAHELGLDQHILMPGFQSNPYVWMKHCDLFVLSSLWEGSPNVLTEAMALGKAVVSTNCPSGPDELLQGGDIAPLVPVANPGALFEAMEKTLKSPPDGRKIQQAVAEYNQRTSAMKYLETLQLI